MYKNIKYLLIGILHSLVPISILLLFTKSYDMIMYLTYRGGITFDYSSENILYVTQIFVLIISIFIIRKILINNKTKHVKVLLYIFINWFMTTILFYFIFLICTNSFNYWRLVVLFYLCGGFITLMISFIISSILAILYKKHCNIIIQ